MEVIELRFAFDSTLIRLRYDYDEKLTCYFLLASNHVKWKQAGAIRRSRIVVVSQSNRNFDHFHRSRMRRGIVVYTTYRRLVVVESQL